VADTPSINRQYSSVLIIYEHYNRNTYPLLRIKASQCNAWMGSVTSKKSWTNIPKSLLLVVYHQEHPDGAHERAEMLRRELCFKERDHVHPNQEYPDGSHEQAEMVRRELCFKERDHVHPNKADGAHEQAEMVRRDLCFKERDHVHHLADGAQEQAKW